MISEKSSKLINDFAVAVTNNSRALNAEYIEREETAEKALVDYIADLEARVEKAEKMIKQFIKAGNNLDEAIDFAWGIKDDAEEEEPGPEQEEWRKLVTKWQKGSTK